MTLRIGCCRVRVSFWFFALTALAACVCGSVMLCGIAAAAVHEAGHILAALICVRRQPVSFDITPFGLRMGVIPEGLARRRELAIAAGGIASNALTAVILFPCGGSCARFAAANVCVALVNAAAAEPLDGGRIMRLLLESRLDADSTERVCFALSVVSVFILTAVGVSVLLRSRGNFSLLLLALWLLARVLRGYCQ